MCGCLCLTSALCRTKPSSSKVVGRPSLKPPSGQRPLPAMGGGGHNCLALQPPHVGSLLEFASRVFPKTEIAWKICLQGRREDRLKMGLGRVGQLRLVGLVGLPFPIGDSPVIAAFSCRACQPSSCSETLRGRSCWRTGRDAAPLTRSTNLQPSWLVRSFVVLKEATLGAFGWRERGCCLQGRTRSPGLIDHGQYGGRDLLSTLLVGRSRWCRQEASHGPVMAAFFFQMGNCIRGLSASFRATSPPSSAALAAARPSRQKVPSTGCKVCDEWMGGGGGGQ